MQIGPDKVVLSSFRPIPLNRDPLLDKTLDSAHLSPSLRETVVDTLHSGAEHATSLELRAAVEARSGQSLEEVSERHPNFFPALLAAERAHPPLRGPAITRAELARAGELTFETRDGQVFALIATSLSELLAGNPRAAQMADDYAAQDIPLKLTVPMGQASCDSLPESAQRALVAWRLANLDQTTVFLHGFQSNKEIWDATTPAWLGPNSFGVALDGFGSDGSARTDGSAPYTPRQYAFQVFECLDALGFLSQGSLKVVGHSMGGAAAGELAVALDKAGHAGPASFHLLAPACSPDSTPFFQPHRDLVNGVLVGCLWVPLGAWDLTAPLIQWTDESLPALSRLVVDHSLGLKDAPEEVREHNAGYYRRSDRPGNFARRDRACEAMHGMLKQKGIDPAELHQASQRFSIQVVNFGADRLVDPQAVSKLAVGNVDYLHLPGANHNANFDPATLKRILV